MTVNEIAPYVLSVLGGALALTALWYIFIKAPRARLAAFEGFARKRNLVYRPPIFLGSHTQGYETSGLEGTVQGVPFLVRSSRLVNSRRAGINGSTEVLVRAFTPTQVSFTAAFEPGRTQGAIPTGDPAFDAAVSTRTDHPHAAVAWLHPNLRGALYGIVTHGTSVALTYAAGETTLRVSRPISEDAEVDRTIALAVAAAYARLP